MQIKIRFLFLGTVAVLNDRGHFNIHKCVETEQSILTKSQDGDIRNVFSINLSPCLTVYPQESQLLKEIHKKKSENVWLMSSLFRSRSKIRTQKRNN